MSSNKIHLKPKFRSNFSRDKKIVFYQYEKFTENLDSLKHEEEINLHKKQVKSLYKLKKIWVYFSILGALLFLIPAAYVSFKFISSLKKEDTSITSVEITKNKSLKVEIADHTYESNKENRMKFDQRYDKFNSKNLIGEKILDDRNTACKTHNMEMLKKAGDNFRDIRVSLIDDLNYFYKRVPDDIYQKMKKNTHATDSTPVNPKDFYSCTEDMAKVFSTESWSHNRKTFEDAMTTFKTARK